MDKIYDILVVGGGPAGVTSAIYAKRAGRDVAIIEKFVIGGQLSLIGEIENYPGFSSIAGDELAKDFRNHAKSLDIPFIYDDISDYDFAGEVKIVASKKQSYKAKAVILVIDKSHKGMVTRNLFYVGASRAQKDMTIIADVGAIESGLERQENKERETWLKDMLIGDEKE